MMPPITATAPRSLSQIIPLLFAYAVGFVALHRLAAIWGGESSFSLWFPAAGLRFALLWLTPFWFTPLVTLTELAAQTATGTIAGPRWWMTALGVVSSSMGYGITIAAVRHLLSSRRSGLSTPPMPLGIAMILCPIVAVAGSLPWALIAAPALPPGEISASFRGTLMEIGIYWLGDLLGILLVAPPMLWLRERRRGWPALRLTPRHWEIIILVGIGWLLSIVLTLVNGVPHVEPVLLSAIWVALRLGRMAAWIVSATATLAILAAAGPDMPLQQRIDLHLLATALLIASYLVGSYAEAEREMQRDLDRAQRMLLRADRLKHLRAMSLAAIHDISQPLSTLGLEARHVRELAEQPDPDRADMIETSRLIERKTNHLMDLVRHLRQFGGAGGQSASIQVSALFSDVAALTRGEAEAVGTTLQVDADAAGALVGRQVELQQALANLVRNAIAATPGGVVTLDARAEEEMIALRVIDDGRGGGESGGLGLGLIIARTIAEAHGGQLRSTPRVPAGSCYALCLPRGGEA